jgi:hypothetical protein
MRPARKKCAPHDMTRMQERRRTERRRETEDDLCVGGGRLAGRQLLASPAVSMKRKHWRKILEATRARVRGARPGRGRSSLDRGRAGAGDDGNTCTHLAELS